LNGINANLRGLIFKGICIVIWHKYNSGISSSQILSQRLASLHDYNSIQDQGMSGTVQPNNDGVSRLATAAFAQAMLAGETQPGVWFPEEREAIPDRRGLLQRAAEGTIRFELNRPPWALETTPKQLGFGMYW
jgi:hypothetical protein